MPRQRNPEPQTETVQTPTVQADIPWDVLRTVLARRRDLAEKAFPYLKRTPPSEIPTDPILLERALEAFVETPPRPPIRRAEWRRDAGVMFERGFDVKTIYAELLLRGFTVKPRTVEQYISSLRSGRVRREARREVQAQAG